MENQTQSVRSEETPAGGRTPAADADLTDLDAFDRGRNWVSLDAPRGLLVCRNLGSEYAEFVCTVLEARVVRVLKDADGTVRCASADRLVADTGRPGRECATCEDRETGCALRWWIAWQDVASGLIFAHTLSQTGSLNFQGYLQRLLAQDLRLNQVVTRLFVEEARRRKAHTVYRRVQFERLDPAA